MRTVNELPTVAPLGFPKMPGVTRRPNFGQWPGLPVAIAAMVKYAKNEPEGLKTRLPRVAWIKHEWTPSVMETSCIAWSASARRWPTAADVQTCCNVASG